MPAIRRLDSRAGDFRRELDALLAWDSVADVAVEQTVREVVAAVRARGDAALLEYSARFDRLQADSVA
ncbi:MAG TPA: histidinol dehydrogenase, partial [Gammaproteobacteria bacterium]